MTLLTTNAGERSDHEDRKLRFTRNERAMQTIKEEVYYYYYCHHRFHSDDHTQSSRLAAQLHLSRSYIHSGAHQSILHERNVSPSQVCFGLALLDVREAEPSSSPSIGCVFIHIC